MIKKVKVDDIRPGVFIDDFNCDWGGGTIYIDKMLVNDLKVVDIIKSWGIDEVFIDTDRGHDISRSTKSRLEPIARSRATPQPGKASRPQGPSPIPFPVEARQALKIRNDAVSVVEDTIKKAEEGKPPNVNQTYELAARMRTSIHRNHDALLLLTRIRKKDEYTLYHSVSVSALILNMCEYLGIPEQQALDLAVAALFHDIGKTRVPQPILTKPARLSPREFTTMKKHVEHSVDLLRNAKNLPLECYDIALHHHERVDGSGYPHGLTGEQIGFGAQLTAICDVYDAVTSARCYKEAMGAVSGLQVVYNGRDTHFNKRLAHEFIHCMGVYPVGSCVRLEDGKIGVIAERTGNMQKPVVKVFHDERRRERFKPFLYDLSQTGISIASYASPKTIGLTPSSLLSSILAA